jgi:hypothetical protein
MQQPIHQIVALQAKFDGCALPRLVPSLGAANTCWREHPSDTLCVGRELVPVWSIVPLTGMALPEVPHDTCERASTLTESILR